jgi:hypothetical protein
LNPADSRRPWLRTILTLTITTRLAVVALVLATYPKGWFFRSQGELGFLAQSILAGHGLSSPFGGATGPTAFLAPGYPALVAAVFGCFGVFTPASAAVLMVLNVAFAAVTALLLVRIAEREFCTFAANCAGLFWALGLPFVFMPLAFWDSNLSLLLLTVALDVALRVYRQPTLALWAEAGAIEGLTLLVNPSFALVLAGMFVWMAVTARTVRVVWPVLAAVVALAIFSPWPLRNARVLHAFIPARSNFAFELWKGNHAGAKPIDDPVYYPVLNRPEYDAYATQGEMAFMAHKSALAKEYIVAHPQEFIRQTVLRFALYWTGTGADGPIPLLAAHEILTTLLSLLGLVLLVRSGRTSVAILFVIPLLLFPLPYYITHAEMRFRILLEPATTLLAAYTATRLAACLATVKMSLQARRPQLTSS